MLNDTIVYVFYVPDKKSTTSFPVYHLTEDCCRRMKGQSVRELTWEEAQEEGRRCCHTCIANREKV